jgi:hypothetical protein
MTARATFVIGKRMGDGQVGVFVALPSADAHYSPVDQMMLAATTSVPQLVANALAVNGQVVVHGLGYIPLIIMTSLSSLGGFGGGNVRPFGNMAYGTGNYSSISVNNSAFAVSTPFGAVGYHLYRQAV